MDGNPTTASLREIFLLAVDQDDPGEREAFLAEACAGNRELRRQVDALLAADTGFRPAPPDDGAGDPDGGAGDECADPEAPGAVGPFRLLEPIGEGSCGTVFKAEQEKPVRRLVALKVLKPGALTREMAARFESERQVLAMMDHPNIANLLDAGSVGADRSYFAMEFVDGPPITEFCDREKLGVGQRLGLFVKVCRAVQFAHQKGVIHRDLKPSNILVADVDGAPEPKVIDFGIAKATEQPPAGRDFHTAVHQFLGTPAYMSPEQAEMSPAGPDVDTRSDIYSLGVLLHELLTGRPPFGAQELFESGFDAMRRTIQHEDPLRPSLRVESLSAEEAARTARARALDPRELVHRIRGDLDWIALKCLEKPQDRRYQTAEALAADLERHLRDEPVLAHPPTWNYRLRKSVRRNRGLFGAAAAVAGSLVAGLALAAWQYHEKGEALDRAVLAEKDQGRLRRIAEGANDRANRELRRSLVTQAHLEPASYELDRRDTALDALRQAIAIGGGEGLLDEAISALTAFQIVDLGPQVQPPADGARLRRASFSGDLARYAWHRGRQDELSVRSSPGHETVGTFSWDEPRDWQFVALGPRGDRVYCSDTRGRLEALDLTDRALGWTAPWLGGPDTGEHFDSGVVAVAPRGELVAQITPAGRVRLVDAQSGQLVRTLEPDGSPTSLAFNPVDPLLAIGTTKGLEVVDVRDERAPGYSRSKNEGSRFVTWSPDGRVVAHIGVTYRLELWQYYWDVSSPPVYGLGGPLATACYSPDGRWLADCDGDGLLTIRTPKSLRPEFEGLAGYPMAFDASSRRLFCRTHTGAGGVTAYEISPSTCYREFVVPFYGDSSLPGLAVSPDGRWLAVTSYSSGIFLWDLEAGGPPAWSYAHRCSSAAFDETGTQLITCSDEGIQRWHWSGAGESLDGPETLVSGATGSSRCFSITYSDPPRIVMTAGDAVWSISLGDTGDRARHPGRDQFSAAISPDGRWLAEGSGFSAVHLRDLHSGEELPDLSPQGGRVTFSPDGRRLAVARPGSVEAWDTATWQREWSTPTDTVGDSAGTTAFRPQGDLIATRGSTTSISLLRPSDGTVLLELSALHPGPISRICFGGNGTILAASTEDGRVHVWFLDRLARELADLGLDWTELAGMPRVAAR